MLAQAGQNFLLDLYRVTRVGLVAEISMNDGLSVIVQENAENGFARPSVVRAIECQSRFRKADVALLGAIS